MRLDHLLSKRKVIVYVYTQWSSYSCEFSEGKSRGAYESERPFLSLFCQGQKRKQIFEITKDGKTTDESLEVKEFCISECRSPSLNKMG